MLTLIDADGFVIGCIGFTDEAAHFHLLGSMNTQSWLFSSAEKLHLWEARPLHPPTDFIGLQYAEKRYWPFLSP